MPRKRGRNGTSPPCVHLKEVMRWSEAEAKFKLEHFQDLTGHQWDKWNYQAWGQSMSVAGMWSFRGAMWKKATGAYPKPEEVGLDADHDFFNPNVVCTTWTTYSSGKKSAREYFHHGRKLKPSNKLYPKTI